jgi:radical SAM superfamily enzyme YgiQ (UPF0313 family)
VYRDGAPSRPVLRRLPFVAPARDKLPPLTRYARLDVGGEQRLAGYTEASRGCLHLCRHCPIPPVYQGRFFAVPREVVLADCEAQISAGARHITFGDPDFLNGPRHAIELARALHRAHPGVTFDFTAKVEHLLRHRRLLPELSQLGCAFVVSAVESLSDRVLARLAKGHTRADVLALLPLMRSAGLPLRPTFMPFTPWAGLGDLLELFELALTEDLVDSIDPIQFTIRLLVPPGSLLATDPEAAPYLRALDAAGFAYRWEHPDPRMDELARALSARVSRGVKDEEPPEALFFALRELAYAAAGSPSPGHDWRREERPIPPKLTEPWFC